MNRPVSVGERGIPLAAILATILMGGCAAAPPISAASDAAGIPAKLVPSGEVSAFGVHALGTQIYECRQAEGKPIAWAFVAPDADLFEYKTQKRIGRHYAGPSWEMEDGSKVVGTVKERADSAAAGAIPQLLLSAKSADAAGRLEKVTSIQRLDTVGGVAPASGCSAATDLGKHTGVYYSADYQFFVLR